jgi:hypothetical protein
MQGVRQQTDVILGDRRRRHHNLSLVGFFPLHAHEGLFQLVTLHDFPHFFAIGVPTSAVGRFHHLAARQLHHFSLL